MIIVTFSRYKSCIVVKIQFQVARPWPIPEFLGYVRLHTILFGNIVDECWTIVGRPLTSKSGCVDS